MTRKFKLAGVLVAVVAMFALTASSASATFTSNTYPVTPTASSTADVFDAFGSTVKCTENTFTIHEYNVTPKAPVTAATETVTATPSYNKCTAFGLPATVRFTGCDYVFHNPAGSTNVTSDLVCPAGVNGVDLDVYSTSAHTTAICHVTVTPFTGKGGLQIHNDHPGLILTGTVEGIVAHQVRTNVVLCPPGTETKEAKYTVQAGGITIHAPAGDTLSVS